MKKITLTITILLLLIFSAQANTFYNIQFDLSGKNTDNLNRDIYAIKERISTIRSTVNIYPASLVELKVFTEYNNYGKNPSLSNVSYGGGITLIPFGGDDKFSLYLSSNFKSLNYKDVLTSNSSDFPSETYDGSISAGYQLSEKIHYRAGFNLNKTVYSLNSSVKEYEFVTDKKINLLYTGVNLNLPGSNTLDIEYGYNFEKYYYLPHEREFGVIVMDDYGINPDSAYSWLLQHDLKSAYISTRISRPLGKKTGLALTFSSRSISDENENGIIYGRSTGYISPWLNTYEGNALQLKLKSYLIPNCIVTAGFGYWNKESLKILETVYIEQFDPFTMETITVPVTRTGNAIDLESSLRRYFFSIKLPLVSSSGLFIEPSLQVEYTNNNANIDTYTYTDFSISTAVTIKI